MSGLQLSRTFFSSVEVRVMVEFALHVHQNTENTLNTSEKLFQDRSLKVYIALSIIQCFLKVLVINF